MQTKKNIEYPAFIYCKNNVYIANCIVFNLISIGKTEFEAVKNLENSMGQVLIEYNISIRPVYENIKFLNAKE